MTPDSGLVILSVWPALAVVSFTDDRCYRWVSCWLCREGYCYRGSRKQDGIQIPPRRHCATVLAMAVHALAMDAALVTDPGNRPNASCTGRRQARRLNCTASAPSRLVPTWIGMAPCSTYWSLQQAAICDSPQSSSDRTTAGLGRTCTAAAFPLALAHRPSSPHPSDTAGDDLLALYWCPGQAWMLTRKSAHRVHFSDRVFAVATCGIEAATCFCLYRVARPASRLI